MKSNHLEYWVRFGEVSKLAFFIFVVTITSKLFSFWYSRRHLRELAKRLPGPTPLPLFGNALRFARKLDNCFGTLMETIELYGTPCRLWMGPKLYVVLTDPRDIAAVLGNPGLASRDGYICKVAEPLMGQGLITSKGETWKNHRKIISPTFNSNIISQFVAEFTAKAKSLNDRLVMEADGATFDIFPLVAATTLDTICSTAMGASSTTPHGGQTYVDNLERSIEITQERFLKPWLYPDFVYRFSKLYEVQETVLKAMNKFTDDIITQRVNKRSKKMFCELDHSEKRNTVLLDMLISASENDGQMFTAKELRDEVNTLIAAGYETSATGICFVLILLAMYPKVQQSVIEEQRQVFGENFNRDVVFSDLQEMQYLDRVIKESLRMFPPAPIIHREIEKEVRLKDVTLVPGCSVLIVNYKTHRLEQYFKNPNMFDPDRFLPDNLKNRHPYAYIPFGSGPRNCIGRYFALVQMKTVISTFVRRFHLSTRLSWTDLLHLDHGIVIRPKCGFKMELLPREEGQSNTSDTGRGD